MPTYNLIAAQEISIVAEIRAETRDAAIDKLAEIAHDWAGRANKELTTLREPGCSVKEVVENEGGWTMFDEDDESGDPIRRV
jgi:hypothetical protein